MKTHTHIPRYWCLKIGFLNYFTSAGHAIFAIHYFSGAKSVENIEAESLLIDMEATLMANSSYELHKNSVKKFNNPFLFIDALSIFAKSLCLKRRQKNPFIPEYEFSAFQSKKVDENSRPFTTQKLIYRQSPFFRYFSSAHFNHPLEKKLVESSVQDGSAAWIIPFESSRRRTESRLIGVETNWKPLTPLMALLIEA